LCRYAVLAGVVDVRYTALAVAVDFTTQLAAVYLSE
jgi:hypothetical protein